MLVIYLEFEILVICLILLQRLRRLKYCTRVGNNNVIIYDCGQLIFLFRVWGLESEITAKVLVRK